MNTTTENRSQWDGLTRDQRQRLYDPTAYTVEKTSEGRFTVTHREVPAVFGLLNCGGGRAMVESNTNGHQLVNVYERTCTCEDHKRHGGERLCKHLAVAFAVVMWAKAQRIRRQEEQRAELAREAAAVMDDKQQAAKFNARRASLEAWCNVAAEVALAVNARYSG